MDHRHWIHRTGLWAGTESPQQWGHGPIPYSLYPLEMGPDEPQLPGDGTSCFEALPSSWEDVLAAWEGTVCLKGSRLGGGPRGQVLGKIPFLPALPRFMKGFLGRWAGGGIRAGSPVRRQLPTVPVSQMRELCLGRDLGWSQWHLLRLSSPGFRLQHWVPAQPGLSAPSPAPPRGAAPQLPSIPFQPRERCPLPTLSHCLGISPETLSAFCCPYLHLFRLIYTFTSSPLPLSASSSLCQLYSRPFLDLSWWPWGH